jgi:arylsulfatase A-like enzyme
MVYDSYFTLPLNPDTLYSTDVHDYILSFTRSNVLVVDTIRNRFKDAIGHLSGQILENVSVSESQNIVTINCKLKVPSKNAIKFTFFQRIRSSMLDGSSSVELTEAISESYVWKANSKPNILLFIGDDWGYGDVGWRMSNKNDDKRRTPTPNFDTFKNEATELMYMFTSPICSPSRAMLWTGRFNHRHGYGPSINNGRTTSLSGRETLLSEILKGNGYHNFITEKWHLGSSEWRNLPLQRGFDHYIGPFSLQYKQRTKTYDGEDSQTLNFKYIVKNVDTLYNMTLDSTSATRFEDTRTYAEKNINKFKYNPNAYENIKTMHNVDVVNIEVKRFIEQFAYSPLNEKPLFINIGTRLPHTPLVPPDFYSNKLWFDGWSNNNNRIKYLKMVHAMDDSFGKITSYLNDHGMYKDTVVIVISDNGGLSNSLGGANNYGMQGRKNLVWLGGTRVISLVKGTSSSLAALEENAKGSDNKDTMHFVDWLPTIATGIAKIKPIDYKKAWKCDVKYDCLSFQNNSLDGSNQWDSIRTGGSGMERLLIPQVIPDVQVDFVDVTESNDSELWEMLPESVWNSSIYVGTPLEEYVEIEEFDNNKAEQYKTIIQKRAKRHGGMYALYGDYYFMFASFDNDSSGKPHMNQARTTDDTLSNFGPCITFSDNLIKELGFENNFQILFRGHIRNDNTIKGCLYNVKNDPNQRTNLMRSIPSNMEQSHIDILKKIFNEYLIQKNSTNAMLDKYLLYGWSNNPAEKKISFKGHCGNPHIVFPQYGYGMYDIQEINCNYNTPVKRVNDILPDPHTPHTPQKQNMSSSNIPLLITVVVSCIIVLLFATFFSRRRRTKNKRKKVYDKRPEKKLNF